MNKIKIIFGFLSLLFVLAGCKKELNDDLSFVSTDTNPAKLSAMYRIPQDNSGLVTITPNGEGLAYTLVTFGDGTATPEKALPGQSVQHKYAEGNYSVKLKGVSVTGLTTEATQPLTVSFRAPENVKVNVAIDAANKFKVNVTATADYATVFNVYFGDVANEVPQSFLPGTTISHVYAKTGTYKVRVVALSGGAASTEVAQDVNIVNPVLLPVDFEDPNQPYPFVNFDGGVSTVINNPFKTGINTSAKTGKMVKNPGQPWGGSLLGLGAPIDFSTGKYFRMKVYSPRVGAKVLLKVENAANGGINFEKEVATTVANAWEDLVFDYTAVNTANVYNNLVLIFDLGTPGDGSANFTWYFDDIRLVSSLPSTTIKMPVDFESSVINYKFTDFGNAAASVINNPKSGANNSSAKVGKLLKANGAEVWAGSFMELGSPIDFSSMKKIKMKVWSPKSGITVKMKLENLADPNKNFEVDVKNTKANDWEDLIFDFSGANQSFTYQRLVVFFDFGNPGNGAEYYFDDIELTTGTEQLVLPLTFQSSTLNYAFTNFDGGNASVINNPDASGVNTSSRVARMVKGPGGQQWGGAFITLDAPIDFSSKKTMNVKVWSPRVGAKVLLKVENLTDGGVAFEKEVSTTKAGQWENLTFDYSAINTSKSYQKVVIIFDLGTVGNGSSDFTWYFDDIILN
jgi:hypothetical protein